MFLKGKISGPDYFVNLLKIKGDDNQQTKEKPDFAKDPEYAT